MVFKLFIVFLLLVVIYSLGSALYYLVNDRGESNRTVKALTWRIGLSLAIFILLLVAHVMGWIQPHAL
jgi:putative copper export protein